MTKAGESITRDETTEAVTAALYEKSQTCSHCGSKIETVHDVYAVESLGQVSMWKLYHKSKSCFALSLFATTPTRGAGISRRQFRGRFS